jgi:hypothetical protein
MQHLKTILILLLLIPIIGFSQYKKGSGNGLYGTGGDVIDKGWYFGLGISYMAGYNNITATIIDTLNSSLSNQYIGNPSGKIGGFAEIGKFKMNSKKFINYIDYGLAWKWLRGGEDYTDEYYVDNVLTSTNTVEGSFGDHLLSAHLNLGYRFDASDNLFYVNGIGLNADYHLLKGRTATPQIPTNTDYTNGPDDFLGELHYFFGIGLKTKGRMIIMPIIETPILALFPFNHIKSTHPYFNGRHRPFLLKVRFMFLKKGSKSCPAVYNPMGIDPKGNLTK